MQQKIDQNIYLMHGKAISVDAAIIFSEIRIENNSSLKVSEVMPLSVIDFIDMTNTTEVHLS